MSKELEALETLKDIDIYTLNEEYSCHEFECCDAQGNLEDCYPQEVSIIEQALKEHEMLKNLVVKMFCENGLDFETWKHFDKSHTYHIVYTNSYEHLDIPISKEEYDFIGDLYGKDRVGD